MTAEKEKMIIQKLSLPQIRRLYKTRLIEDFPPDELKPLAAIEAAFRKNRYVCYGVGEDIEAYAFFLVNGSAALLDYFAVKENLRNQGYGGRFLQVLMKDVLVNYSQVLLETENPDYAENEEDRAIRERRLSFYIRNGMIDTGVTANAFHVEYRILAMPAGKAATEDEIALLYETLYRTNMPKLIADRMVRVNARSQVSGDVWGNKT